MKENTNQQAFKVDLSKLKKKINGNIHPKIIRKN